MNKDQAFFTFYAGDPLAGLLLGLWVKVRKRIKVAGDALTAHVAKQLPELLDHALQVDAPGTIRAAAAFNREVRALAAEYEDDEVKKRAGRQGLYALFLRYERARKRLETVLADYEKDGAPVEVLRTVRTVHDAARASLVAALRLVDKRHRRAG